MNQDTKICSKCKTIKIISEYTKSQKTKDGYAYSCKECDHKTGKQWRINNPLKIKEKRKRWRIHNPEKYKQRNRRNSKRRTLKNPQYMHDYYQSHKNLWKISSIKRKAKRNQYQIQRRKTDVNFQISCNLRSRMNRALRNNQKSGHLLEILGCSIPELKTYLENQFLKGMTWKNYGQWHIDHKIPCSIFDMSNPIEQKQCFHYTNLQPLWAEENFKKSDKIDK